jgi:nitrate/TMAO reductase-like tetraheme cytochrome c subunit
MLGWPAVLAAATGAEAPVIFARPEGWIGTTAQWTVGLGLALGLLDLAILWFAWRGLSSGLSDLVKVLLLVGLVVLPLMLTFLGYQHGFSSAETVASCGACHVMGPHVADLRDPSSRSLAALHYQNRFIQENQCYTCHRDYGLFGTFEAKVEGVRHVAHWVTGTYTLPLKIAHPYSNLRCLACHGESRRFLTAAPHSTDLLRQLALGSVSCLDCHGPAHTPKGSGR